MSKIGFTGTQLGMSPSQQRELAELLRDGPLLTLHHGDCIGADAEAHEIARRLRCRVVVHPPDDPKKRAWKKGDEERPELPYLTRNRVIVAETALLIVAPQTDTEILRSGTWSTKRYAQQAGRQCIILLRNGGRRLE